MNPAAAQQASGELAHLLFWAREASGPIALGIVTLAIAAAVTGYSVTAIIWRLWLVSKLRHKRRARLGL
jgi:uncharacterized protein (DUF2062 family)